MDFVGAEQLLGEFQLWNDLDSKAKRRYQAQLAPDFRLMMFLQRDENALSRYLGERTALSIHAHTLCVFSWRRLRNLFVNKSMEN